MSEELEYLRDEHGHAFELAAWIRRAVLEADPDLTERVYRDWRGRRLSPPRGRLRVRAIYPRSEWVVLLLEHRASMPDPDEILLGDGKQTRFVRVREPSSELRGRIVAYVQQAVAQRLLR